MTWKLNGVRIYVEDDSGWIPTPRKGLINILNSTNTIVHQAGREAHTRSLTFVIFSGYYASILPITALGTVTLEDDSATETDVTVLDMKPERLYDYLDRKIHRVKVELMEIS